MQMIWFIKKGNIFMGKLFILEIAVKRERVSAKSGAKWTNRVLGL